MINIFTAAEASAISTNSAWEYCTPEDAGFNAASLEEAVAFAVRAECDWPRSMHTEHGEYVGTAYLQEQPPSNEVLGPVQPRGPTAGMVVRHGKVVAQMGAPYHLARDWSLP